MKLKGHVPHVSPYPLREIGGYGSAGDSVKTGETWRGFSSERVERTGKLRGVVVVALLVGGIVFGFVLNSLARVVDSVSEYRRSANDSYVWLNK
jgi:hypothetical protein